MNPSCLRAYVLLGILTVEHGNFAKGIDVLEKALANGDRADALAQIARCYIALAQKDKAIKTVRVAISCRPYDATTLDTIGVVFSRAGLHRQAIDYYDRAIGKRDDVAPYYYNRGVALQFLGKLEEAEASYRRAASIDVHDRRALPAAAMLTKHTIESEDIKRLTELFREAEISGDEDAALRIGHALSKCYEDLQDVDTAMSWLVAAKKLRLANTQSPSEQNSEIFGATRHLSFSGQSPGFSEGSPIFVVGMPRTGTTLVDRIISSHSDVTSAGELSDFGLILKQLSGTQSNWILDPETLHNAIDINHSELGELYLRKVYDTQGEIGRFIDKMPLNFFYVPIILRSLPNARIVCLRRHPADIVLSNYRQLFSTNYSYYTYSYDLSWAAEFVVEFCRLMNHLEKTMPAERFIIVDYEAIVDDIESQTRRLLDFCGLSFQKDCLAFHQNSAPVATASSAQVRRPIYRSSISRWKTYRTHMKSALRILESAGML